MLLVFSLCASGAAFKQNFDVKKCGCIDSFLSFCLLLLLKLLLLKCGCGCFHQIFWACISSFVVVVVVLAQKAQTMKLNESDVKQWSSFFAKQFFRISKWKIFCCRILTNFENFLIRLRALGLSDKPVQERGVGEEAILILGIGHLSEKGLGVLLGDGVT